MTNTEHPRELRLTNGTLAICTLVASAAFGLSFLLPPT